MGKILIVDDAKDVHILLKHVFEPEYTITSAYTIFEASNYLDAEKFDLLLLDVKLPDGSGFNFCAGLQQNSQFKKMPVVFITGMSELSDKSMGFLLGAEDYITKPFNSKEVKLRCESKIRKMKSMQTKEDVLKLGDLRIEIPTQRVFRHNGEKEDLLSLTPTGFKLLYYLVSNVGQVFTRDQLISSVWGHGISIVDRTVDTHIGALRKQLEDSSVCIEAVHGVGYRLTCSNKKMASA